MFSGIVEATGTVVDIIRNDANIDLKIRCPFTQELKIDQSVAHNGVCLTVTSIDDDARPSTAQTSVTSP